MSFPRLDFEIDSIGALTRIGAPSTLSSEPVANSRAPRRAGRIREPGSSARFFRGDQRDTSRTKTGAVMLSIQKILVPVV
jgi:hypothetical protein